MSDATRLCPVCAAPVTRNIQAVYCGKSCAKRAEKERARQRNNPTTTKSRPIVRESCKACGTKEGMWWWVGRHKRRPDGSIPMAGYYCFSCFRDYDNKRAKARYAAKRPGPVRPWVRGGAPKKIKPPKESFCVDCNTPLAPTVNVGPKVKRCWVCQSRVLAARAERRKFSATKPWVSCETCGTLVPDRKGAAQRRFCSYACAHPGKSFGGQCPWPDPERPIASRIVVWQCEGCERVFVDHGKGARKRRFCSRACNEVATGVVPRQSLLVVALCDNCGSAFSSPHTSARFCSERCNKAEHNRRRRHHARAGGGEKFSTREIAERDNWTCHLCGEAVPDKAWDGDIDCATLDHLIPVSLGGTHTKDNVKLAHFMCNTLRGTAPLETSDASS